MPTKAMTIDLNLDAGEDPAALNDGRELALYRLVSSINVACGGHAGDDASMRGAIALALPLGLAIGAHPSYPDRAGFGRTPTSISSVALTDELALQIDALVVVAASLGASVSHVKPHGALYNRAADDGETARAVIAAIKKVDSRLALVGLAGSAFLQRARDAGLAAHGEAFADRRYEPDGRLRSRSYADALIAEPTAAADQAESLVRDGRVFAVGGAPVALRADTLCVHGDTPGALATARAVRERLQACGLKIARLG